MCVSIRHPECQVVQVGHALLVPGLGSITIVIIIDCNRLQLERNRNCNRNQIFLDSCVIVID